MNAQVNDIRSSMSGVERMKLPQRVASKVRIPMKVREASIRPNGSPLLR